MSTPRVITVLTDKDLIRKEDAAWGTTYVHFKKAHIITCHVCHKWIYSRDMSIPIMGTRASHLVELDSKYYIIPYYHEECREMFNLCPEI